MSKLTKTQRQQFYEDYENGMSPVDLAAKYNISRQAAEKRIAKIVAIDSEPDVELELNSNVMVLEDEIQSDMRLFRDGTIGIARRVIELVKNGNLGVSDLERAQNVLLKGKETILGKSIGSATPPVDNVITYTWEDT